MDDAASADWHAAHQPTGGNPTQSPHSIEEWPGQQQQQRQHTWGSLTEHSSVGGLEHASSGSAGFGRAAPRAPTSSSTVPAMPDATLDVGMPASALPPMMPPQPQPAHRLGAVEGLHHEAGSAFESMAAHTHQQAAMPDANLDVPVPASASLPIMPPQPHPAHRFGAIESVHHEAGSAVESMAERTNQQPAALMDVDTPSAGFNAPPEAVGSEVAHQGEAHEPATSAEVAHQGELHEAAPSAEVANCADEIPQPSAAPGSSQAQPEEQPREAAPHGAEQQQAANKGAPAGAAQPPPPQQDEPSEQAAADMPAAASTPLPTKVPHMGTHTCKPGPLATYSRGFEWHLDTMLRWSPYVITLCTVICKVCSSSASMSSLPQQAPGSMHEA